MELAVHACLTTTVTLASEAGGTGGGDIGCGGMDGGTGGCDLGTVIYVSKVPEMRHSPISMS